MVEILYGQKKTNKDSNIKQNRNAISKLNV